MTKEAPRAADHETEVVIAGGGLVGLLLGHALAGAGIETMVIDPEPPAQQLGAAFDGRVSSIALGSKRVLEGIGLWAGLAPEAEPILEIRVSDGAAPLFLHYDHRAVGPEPLGFIVPNQRIRRALDELVGRSKHLHRLAPASVVALEHEPASVLARLEDGRIIRARLAVGADGRRSRIREGAGIGTQEWRYEQTGIVCTVGHERPHRGIAHERFLPAGPFAILPLQGRRSSIVWTERAALAPGLLALSDDAFLAELGQRFGDFLGTLALEGGRWSYPLALTHAEHYVGRRLALIGDAAHAIHPIAGQGYNLGIRDVAALAELVVDAHRLGLDFGAADVLARYQRWRRFDTLSLIAVTDGLNRLFSTASPSVQLIRDLGLATINQVPPLKRFFMRHAMGTVGDLPRLARGLPL
jgi:2-octaprenyl-6-methoxyphenol hydroxylase